MRLDIEIIKQKQSCVISLEIPKVTYYYVSILNKSQAFNKLFERDIDIKRIFYLTSPGKTGRVV